MGILCKDFRFVLYVSLFNVLFSCYDNKKGE